MNINPNYQIPSRGCYQEYEYASKRNLLREVGLWSWNGGKEQVWYQKGKNNHLNFIKSVPFCFTQSKFAQIIKPVSRLCESGSLGNCW